MQFSVNILSFEYHQLNTQWEVRDPVRPYWRLWWHNQPGIKIKSNGTLLDAGPDTVTLIAPHTDFRQELVNSTRQFHVHFQLGTPFTHPAPGLHSFPMAFQLSHDLHVALQSMGENVYRQTWALTRLVQQACSSLPESTWQQAAVIDSRLETVLKLMEEHISEPLTNEKLASAADLSPTAFMRIFKQYFNLPPQQHYIDRRLEHAALMLEYGHASISEVAKATGFCDRNYFSTVFRRKLGEGPATYRRKFRRANGKLRLEQKRLRTHSLKSKIEAEALLSESN